MTGAPMHIGDASLWIEDVGQGAPVLFLHGFSLDSRQWEPQLADLSATHRCITVDMRGFGRSDPPTGSYDHAEDIAALVAQLDLDRPALVGLSLGANVAMAFAARYPDRLSRLALVSSGLRGHDWSETRPPDAVRAHAARNGILAAKDFWLAHEVFASIASRPDARDQLRRMVIEYSGWHWENPDPQTLPPSGEDPSQIACPTLIVSGRRDVAGYREIAVRLADLIPDARLVVFDDAGHMLPMEEPERFNALLRKFLPEEEVMP